MIEAVLLDLDDTCFDQREFLAGAFGAVARRGGELGVDEMRLREALATIAAAGSDRGRIIDQALQAMGACVPVGPLVDAFRSYRPVRLSPYPEVRESLSRMRALAPIGLVTNGDPAGQRAKLAALALDDAFDVVVLSDELGRSYRKPHPAPFCQALRLLGADPSRSFFIGDHPDRDIAGAQRVGLRAIRVRTGEYATRPDVVTPWRTAPDAASALRDLCRLACCEEEEILLPMDQTPSSAHLSVTAVA
jgi:putative hydrolase of the HAD superfamily